MHEASRISYKTLWHIRAAGSGGLFLWFRRIPAEYFSASRMARINTIVSNCNYSQLQLLISVLQATPTYKFEFSFMAVPLTVKVPIATQKENAKPNMWHLLYD